MVDELHSADFVDRASAGRATDREGSSRALSISTKHSRISTP